MSFDHVASKFAIIGAFWPVNLLPQVSTVDAFQGREKDGLSGFRGLGVLGVFRVFGVLGVLRVKGFGGLGLSGFGFRV